MYEPFVVSGIALKKNPMTDLLRTSRRPSLRWRLLAFLMLPMIALLLIAMVFIYQVIDHRVQKENDRSLVADAMAVANLLSTEKGSQKLASQVRDLITFDPEDRTYFVAYSSRRGKLGGTTYFPQQSSNSSALENTQLWDDRVDGQPVRVASVRFTVPGDVTDQVTVVFAETTRGRTRLARELLLLTFAVEGVLIGALLLLVWFGVDIGLRSLTPLLARLAGREPGLEPITDDSVPREILPLTRTIDELFGRVRASLTAQEEFIADAAHQLRTPLAGLQLHAGQAIAANSPAAMRQALDHVLRLTARANRTSTQLLALTRAQLASPRYPLLPLDVAALAKNVLTARIDDGVRANVDLGYQGHADAAMVRGDATSLREMLDNLIDNALTHLGNGSQITVAVERLPHGKIALSVEDDGPGVATEFRQRLGERFFRPPGTEAAGCGLGLAIVKRIAARHDAVVEFGPGTSGGLRVTILFAECQNS